MAQGQRLPRTAIFLPKTNSRIETLQTNTVYRALQFNKFFYDTFLTRNNAGF